MWCGGVCILEAFPFNSLFVYNYVGITRRLVHWWVGNTQLLFNPSGGKFSYATLRFCLLIPSFDAQAEQILLNADNS